MQLEANRRHVFILRFYWDVRVVWSRLIYIYSRLIAHSLQFTLPTAHVTLWPWPLTLWSWTFLVCRLSRSQTLYQFLAKSSNPRRSYGDFSIWPNDLEHESHVALRSEIISPSFNSVSRSVYPFLTYNLFNCWYGMSRCDLDLWPIDLAGRVGKISESGFQVQPSMQPLMYLWCGATAHAQRSNTIYWPIPNSYTELGKQQSLSSPNLGGHKRSLTCLFCLRYYVAALSNDGASETTAIQSRGQISYLFTSVKITIGLDRRNISVIYARRARMSRVCSRKSSTGEQQQQ